MGASLVYLNEPNKDIEHEKGSNDYLAFACGNMQGWRLNMVSPYLITNMAYSTKRGKKLSNIINTIELCT